jgi:hypothetical protein
MRSNRVGPYDAVQNREARTRTERLRREKRLEYAVANLFRDSLAYVADPNDEVAILLFGRERDEASPVDYFDGADGPPHNQGGPLATTIRVFESPVHLRCRSQTRRRS